MTRKSTEVAVEPLNLNVKAAAKLLGSTVWAVRTAAWAGKIRTVKIGRRLLFPVEELRRYNQQQMGAR